MNPTTQPNPTAEAPAGAGFSLDDVYFTIFRHKWLILICLCLGTIGASVMYKITKPIYSSEAKLLVRYILDATDFNPANKSANVIGGNSGAQSVLNSEAEILTTADLAQQVAQEVGPARILASTGGGTNLYEAAGVIAQGVSASASRVSDVITVSFSNPDWSIVQPVLASLIKAYQHKHNAIRLNLGLSENDYSEQQAEYRKKLAEADQKLKQLLIQANVIDVAQTKKTYSLQIETLKGRLLDAQSELYALRNVLGEDNKPAGETNAPPAVIPAEKLDDYSVVISGLKELTKLERQLMLQYTEEHPSVTRTRERIAQLKERKAELEREYPGLALSMTVSANGDMADQRAKMRDLTATVAALGKSLTNVQNEALKLMDMEPEIADAIRQRDQNADMLDHAKEQILKLQKDDDGGNKVTGINVFEEPTPPISSNKKLHKKVAAVFGGMLALGLGLAALFDFVLDRTIKRSADVKRHLHLPMFLTIPDTCWGGANHLGWFHGHEKNGEATADAAAQAVGRHFDPWEQGHHLYRFTQGMRERLVTYFEIHNLNHKPKLVAVTGCNTGAGVSTLAGGLAAALSRTGECNVLLMDTSGDQGVVKQFYKGEPGYAGEDAPAPEEAKDEAAPADLTMAKASPQASRPRKMLPDQLSHLAPAFAAKSYDYIVFDMPPVSPTSVTPRMASYMDLVLLVLESEKTGQQAASRANALLTEAKANTVAVLNKYRRYVPEALSQEI